MIAQDQPVCFLGGMHAYVSSTDDGTMLDRSGVVATHEILSNRERYTQQCGISYQDCINQVITYDDEQTYDVVYLATSADMRRDSPGVNADAIIVEDIGIGVFLPVADCVATVAYDSVRKVFAVMHLGRHSTLAKLIEKTLAAMKSAGSDLEHIVIWMGPSVQGTHYRLAYFTHEDEPDWQGFYTKDDKGYLIDMQKYNASRAAAMGVPLENIHISGVNTATDEHYFSHSQGDTSGRFAMVAWRAA